MLRSKKLSVSNIYSLVITLLCCLIAICGFSYLSSMTNSSVTNVYAESESKSAENVNYTLIFDGQEYEKGDFVVYDDSSIFASYVINFGGSITAVSMAISNFLNAVNDNAGDIILNEFEIHFSSETGDYCSFASDIKLKRVESLDELDYGTYCLYIGKFGAWDSETTKTLILVPPKKLALSFEGTLNFAEKSFYRFFANSLTFNGVEYKYPDVCFDMSKGGSIFANESLLNVNIYDGEELVNSFECFKGEKVKDYLWQLPLSAYRNNSLSSYYYSNAEVIENTQINESCNLYLERVEKPYTVTFENENGEKLFDRYYCEGDLINESDFNYGNDRLEFLGRSGIYDGFEYTGWNYNHLVPISRNITISPTIRRYVIIKFNAYIDPLLRLNQELAGNRYYNSSNYWEFYAYALEGNIDFSDINNFIFKTERGITKVDVLNTRYGSDEFYTLEELHGWYNEFIDVESSFDLDRAKFTFNGYALDGVKLDSLAGDVVSTGGKDEIFEIKTLISSISYKFDYSYYYVSRYTFQNVFGKEFTYDVISVLKDSREVLEGTTFNLVNMLPKIPGFEIKLKTIDIIKNTILTTEDIYNLPQVEVRYMSADNKLVETRNIETSFIRVKEIANNKDFLDSFKEAIRNVLLLRFGDLFDQAQAEHVISSIYSQLESVDTEEHQLLLMLVRPDIDIDANQGIFKGASVDINASGFLYFKGYYKTNDYIYYLDASGLNSDLVSYKISVTYGVFLDDVINAGNAFWNWVKENYVILIIIGASIVAYVLILAIAKLIRAKAGN